MKTADPFLKDAFMFFSTFQQGVNISYGSYLHLLPVQELRRIFKSKPRVTAEFEKLDSVYRANWSNQNIVPGIKEFSQRFANGGVLYNYPVSTIEKYFDKLGKKGHPLVDRMVDIAANNELIALPFNKARTPFVTYTFLDLEALLTPEQLNFTHEKQYEIAFAESSKRVAERDYSHFKKGLYQLVTDENGVTINMYGKRLYKAVNGWGIPNKAVEYKSDNLPSAYDNGLIRVEKEATNTELFSIFAEFVRTKSVESIADLGLKETSVQSDFKC